MDEEIVSQRIAIESIGIIESPFTEVANMPIQPLSGLGIRGRIILRKEFEIGLKGLEGFSHITLLYLLHKITEFALTVTPFMDTEEHGIFATRSPKRPNRVGISTVRLVGIEKNILHIEDMDVLNGTPLIDIKPYFPQFDSRENTKSGWLEKRKDLQEEKWNLRSDTRFKE